MAYQTFDFANAEKTYLTDAFNKELTVVKVKTSRWLLCEEDGTVVSSKRSEGEVLNQVAKIEIRRMRGNLHGYRFGKRIDASVVSGYAVAVWGERFSYDNIEFDGHYWWMDISEAADTTERVRADYHINYERLPAFAA